MEKQLFSINTGVLDQMLDPPAVKGTWTTYNPMYFITFLQKQLGQIRTILSGDACDKGFFQIDNKLKKTLESFDSIKAKFNMRIFELINHCKRHSITLIIGGHDFGAHLTLWKDLYTRLQAMLMLNVTKLTVIFILVTQR